MASISQTVQKIVTRSGQDALHIRLCHVPRTVLPNDLLRLCSRAKVENVAKVALEYKRFRPTGNAFVTFTDPRFVPSALDRLKNSTIGGKDIWADTFPPPQTGPSRTRGVKGRQEAVERGLTKGDGLNAGLVQNDHCVVIWGLPGTLKKPMLVDALKAFKLAGSEGGKEVVFKAEPPALQMATSRWVVHLSSVAEAYRLVRKFHMAKWNEAKTGSRYITRAAVIA